MSRHSGDAPNQVVHRTGASRAIAGAGQHFHIRRNDAAAAAQHIFAVGGRALLDELQLEHAGRADDLLRAVDVGYAGQLDEDLVGALLRDARFGDAKLIDAPLDGLPRLHDSFLAKPLRDVRTHAERVAAAGAGAAVEIDGLLLSGLTERLLLPGRHTVDAERRHIEDRDVRRHAAALQLFLETAAVLLGLHAQGVVGLHAQHKVHAPLEVETKLQLVIQQPLRRRQFVAVGQNRVDPDPEEHDEDSDDGDDLPA